MIRAISAGTLPMNGADMLAKSGGQNLVPGCFELELEIAAWSLSRCTQEAQSNATYSFGTQRFQYFGLLVYTGPNYWDLSCFGDSGMRKP